jgi:cardiolipin synthase
VSSSPRSHRYVERPERLCGGNRLELLVGGAAIFDAMLAAIAQATDSVHLTTYILCSDATGRRFGEALKAQARLGRDVRLMFDAVGSYDTVDDDFLTELAEAGVRVHIYRPILPARRRLLEKLQQLHAAYERSRKRPVRPPSRFSPDFWGFHRRNHQKILVVDRRVAFTGGVNIGDDYVDRVVDNRGVRGWHDLHVRIAGPAAITLENAFLAAWNRSGAVAKRGERETPCIDAPVKLEVCVNAEWDVVRERFRNVRRTSIRDAYFSAIRDAERCIRIANAYFLPDRGLRKALKRACERGVRVQVIVPRDSDVRAVFHASRYYYDELLAAGVEIHEYVGRMMHAKAAVIDSAWSTIGSFNLDQRSFRHNLEAGVHVLDAEFSARIEAQFEEDLTHCEQVSLDAWRRRSWHARLREHLCHLFVAWM